MVVLQNQPTWLPLFKEIVSVCTYARAQTETDRQTEEGGRENEKVSVNC